MTNNLSDSDEVSSNAHGVSAVSAVVCTGNQNPYLDAANRLERNLDEQIATLREINDQAEHVTRLLALLLGVFASTLSIGVRVQWFGNVYVSPAPQVLFLFALGIGALLLSMGAAIITYLRSRYRVGLNATVGHLLGNPNYDAETERHIKRVLGTYAYNIEYNTAIIEANSRQFRWSLLLLLVGILCIATASGLYLSDLYGAISLLFALGIVIVVGAVSWYVLSDRYLT